MKLSKFLTVSALALTAAAGAANAAYPSDATTTTTSSTVVTPNTTYNNGTYPSSSYGSGSASGSYSGMGTPGNMAGSSTLGSSYGTTTSRTMTQPMTASAAGVVADPGQIRSCLCLENQYKSLQTDMSAKQAAYSQATAQEASMDAQLSGGHVPSGDLNQFRAASEQRIELQNQINAQYIPNLQQATDRYNNAVTAYQQSCGGRTFNADVMAQVQTHLACAQ